MPPVLLERPKAGLALLRLNRPEARNALNMEVRRLMSDHLAALAADDDVRCILLAGSDTAFAAGADIAEMADAGPIEVMRRAPHRLWQALTACPKPIVAAVNGFALGGGCELALHADIIVAGAGARFGLPEVKLGILPGGGGTQRLVRAVGKYKALHLMLTGELFGAAQADAMGLVSLVVPDSQTETRAIEIASRIAAHPPLAVELIKEVTLAGADGALDEGLRLERKALHVLFASQDQKEGMRAFLDKRPPNFFGR
ncbi:enoyl-CoA hydratase-related protein [Xanthobacter sp. DSM 24535]|uniref:enoyl-CoA hydratase-related protein n=1 Tax=Roseixanthobacter psychrophilus TaxID=3119917 RepID=UPI00372636AC